MFVLGFALLLTSCSTLKLVYNQSEDFTYWWLDGYVDFDSAQKDFTLQALKDIHQWHRNNELPKYLALLDRLGDASRQDITPAQACEVIDEVKTHALTLFHYAEPASAQLVLQFKPQQLRNIQKRYDKSNKSWREDFLDGSEAKRLKFRTNKALDQLEDLYGDLSEPQLRLLTLWLSNAGFDPRKVDAERLRRQADSLRVFKQMQQDGTPAGAQALLRTWLEQDFESPDETYRTYIHATTLKNCEGFAQLHNSTTVMQRRHLLARLAKYADDVRGLMAKP